ncbi:MAG: CBM9 family sugar-binding protein [Cytophagaceae bacterium]|jgi:hypothetical protein|nr:CBM9 family sugar-binding protein [Cytophagaceae bacterium]
MKYVLTLSPFQAHTWCILASLFIFFASQPALSQSNYDVYQADAAPTIDGEALEPIWSYAAWKTMDQVWLGATPTASDFQGRFKLCWYGNKIYILAELTDNALYDGHTNPLDQWYNDDCVEIFIDEDNSNGNHQCNYQAFAYHVAINGDVVDLGTDCQPHLYNSHVQSDIKSAGNLHTWELAMTIYGNGYTNAGPNTPVSLFNGKTCGFSLAYCDDDGSNVRESFIGSEVMPAGHNDDNYKTSDYFGNIHLKGVPATLSLESFLEIDKSQLVVKNSGEKIIQYTVYSSTGVPVFHQDGDQYPASLKAPTGMYVIVAETNEGHLLNKRILYQQ